MKTNSEAYKDHLENKYLPGRDKYLQWFFYPKILRQFSDDMIVDLGCGTGEFLRFLKLRGKKVSGVDNNPYLVEKCSSMGFDVKLDDVTKLQHVDMGMKNAMCDNVLEHLELNQIDGFFTVVKSKMAKDGTLVIVVPDKKGFKHDPTHITFVDRNLIEGMCDKHNLKLQNCFSHPLNIVYVGDFFYLNMQVFTVRF